jgi:hypothetical protein
MVRRKPISKRAFFTWRRRVRILAPHVQRLLDQAGELMRELAPIRQALIALLNDRPSGVTDILASERGRKPLAETRAAAATSFHTINAVDDKQSNLWEAGAAALRENPHAPLSLL